MKKYTFIFTALILFLISCAQADGNAGDKSDSSSESAPAPVGKLYLNTTMWSGSLSIKWIWIGADGSIVVDPKHGVDPIDIAAETKDNAANTGTFKVVNTDLVITWKNGKSEKWGFEKKGADFSYLNVGVLTKQPSMAANYKLTGKFSAGAVTANLAATSTLVFSGDGKFTEGRMGSVSTPQDGASSSDRRTGTYNITGNTLKLNYSSGEKVAAVIAIMDIGGRKWLIINDSSYPQQ